MNTLIKVIFSLLIIHSSFISFSQTKDDIPEAIINSLKSGNSTELAKFFNSNIELTILDKEEVYSKAQAELILKDFFVKNPPSNFSIIHKGGKEGSKYIIGNLITTKKTYRAYILYKPQNNKQSIHQLRIENSEE